MSLFVTESEFISQKRCESSACISLQFECRNRKLGWKLFVKSRSWLRAVLPLYEWICILITWTWSNCSNRLLLIFFRSCWLLVVEIIDRGHRSCTLVALLFGSFVELWLKRRTNKNEILCKKISWTNVQQSICITINILAVKKKHTNLRCLWIWHCGNH